MFVYVVRHAQSRGNVDDPENHPFPPELAAYENDDPSLPKRVRIRQTDSVAVCHK